MAFLARAGGSIHPREWLLKSAAVAPIERGFHSAYVCYITSRKGIADKHTCRINGS